MIVGGRWWYRAGGAIAPPPSTEMRPIVSNLDAYPEQMGPPPESTVSAYEREAELLAGLASRAYREREAERITEEQLLSWQDLYDMFYAGKKISKALASQWADRIIAKGVQRP